MSKQAGADAMAAFQRCLPLFQALGDQGRHEILLTIATQGRLNVGQIAERSPLSRPAVSHHLKVLKAAGLVAVEREGTENYYCINAGPALEDLQGLINALGHVCLQPKRTR